MNSCGSALLSEGWSRRSIQRRASSRWAARGVTTKMLLMRSMGSTRTAPANGSGMLSAGPAAVPPGGAPRLAMAPPGLSAGLVVLAGCAAGAQPLQRCLDFFDRDVLERENPDRHALEEVDIEGADDVEP